jgi:cytochrome P450
MSVFPGGDDEIGTYDPFGPQMFEDPYPVYRRFRQRSPLYYNRELDLWALFRFRSVQSVSRDWKTFTSTKGVDIDGTADMLGSGAFNLADPPAHTAVRGAMRDVFTPRYVTDLLEEKLHELVATLVAEMGDRGAVDFAADLAWVFPVRVAALLLEFPTSDCSTLQDLTATLNERVPGDPRIPQAGIQAAYDIAAYFADLVSTRLREGRRGTGLLDSIAFNENGRAREEAAGGMAAVIFLGATETTVSLISNMLYYLDRFRDQRQWLIGHPEGVVNAVEEVLRFDSPVQAFKRTATRDVEIDGANILRGSTVVLVYGSANRDELQFPDGETLDISRKSTRHLAFGEGVHHCLGALVARLVARIVLGAVLAEFPNYELTAEGSRMRNPILRGFLSLPGVTSGA